jgi:hypothetical protein
MSRRSSQEAYERYCARQECGALFMVPGDRSPQGDPRYCSPACTKAANSSRQSMIYRATVNELITRHHAEYLEIRKSVHERLNNGLWVPGARGRGRPPATGTPAPDTRGRLAS